MPSTSAEVNALRAELNQLQSDAGLAPDLPAFAAPGALAGALPAQRETVAETLELDAMRAAIVLEEASKSSNAALCESKSPA